MVSSKEILDTESSFCLLISEQWSPLSDFLFLKMIIYLWPVSHNQWVLPLGEFAGDVDVGIWFLEILPRTVLVLTGDQEGGEDIPELLLAGPGRGEM